MLVMSLNPCWGHAIERYAETSEILIFPRRGSYFRGSRVPKPQEENHPPYPPRNIREAQGWAWGASRGHFCGCLALRLHFVRPFCDVAKREPSQKISCWVILAVFGSPWLDFR